MESLDLLDLAEGEVGLVILALKVRRCWDGLLPVEAAEARVRRVGGMVVGLCCVTFAPYGIVVVGCACMWDAVVDRRQ